MKRFLLLAVIALVGWRYLDSTGKLPRGATADEEVQHFSTGGDDESPTTPFSCDGRTRCSQMHSCAEATFFIENCPSTEMDGDNDGVPCESQWCGGR